MSVPYVLLVVYSRDALIPIYFRSQTKQLKLIPFPTYELDTDVSMSDASSDHESMAADLHHGRFNSTSSTISLSASDIESRMYSLQT